MLHDKTANITLNACAHYLAKLKKQHSDSLLTLTQRRFDNIVSKMLL